jgi:SGNH domain (fused to AT3 domains)
MGAAIAVAAVAALAAAAVPAAQPTPRCFGAAARDPRHPCHNPRLRYAVMPTPADAQITPNLPCTRIETDGPGTVFDGALGVCAFGTPAERAVATVALVGDSHAMNWQAPVDVVARAKGWRALSMARSHCPFSSATILLSAADRAGCLLWRLRVVNWFNHHPEVNVLFVAQYTSRVTPVLARPGQTQFEAQADGYARAWRSLPATVRHVVVIRDNPQIRTRTFPCVLRARARKVSPGKACAMRRAAVLRPDPAAVAARRMHSPRVRIADLSRFMCGRRLCYPVVGGVLVNKDPTHLTTLFATSLGPYLLRRVDQLVRSWREDARIG